MAPEAQDTAVAEDYRPPRREGLTSREARKEPNFEVPLSMIDVVFLLLIFFIVTLEFKVPEERMDIDLPTDQGPLNVSSQEELDEETIMIYLFYRTSADRSSEWRNRHFGGLGLRIRVNQTVVGTGREALQALYLKLQQLAATSTENPIQLFATTNCPFGVVVSAIDSCKRVKFTKLRFVLPLREEGGGSDEWHIR